MSDKEYALKHAFEYARSQDCDKEQSQAYAKFYLEFHESHGYSFNEYLPHSHPNLFPAFYAQLRENDELMFP